MHLGNGAITPGCAVVTFGAATAGLGFAAAALRRTGLDRNQLLSAGALTGAIFAAQMVNVPVLPFSSAHLVGGVLAAWVLGPSLGALSMAIVLTGQALLLGDGGLASLGANIVNMGLLPAGIVSLVQRRPGRVTAGLLAGISVVAAAALIIGEVALFRSASEIAGLGSFSIRMFGVHLWIAIPESLVTVGILMLLGGVGSPGKWRLDELRIGGCWGIADILVICILPFASAMPDGYESAAELGGMPALLSEDQATVSALGQLNAACAAWQSSLISRIHDVFATEQLLGLVATLLAGSTTFGVAKFVAQRGLPDRLPS
jgi:cobalt/nickel transport system permease protein